MSVSPLPFIVVGSTSLTWPRSIGQLQTNPKPSKVPKHVAHAREAVQQQQLRRFGRPRLAVENFGTIDIGSAISDRHHETLLCNLTHDIKKVIG